MRLRTTVERDAQGDFTFIRVEEQIVVGNRQKLKALVCDCIDNGARRIKIDMSACSYVDSSGLGMLHAVAVRSTRGFHPGSDPINEAKKVEWEFELVNLQEDIQTLFELTKLDVLFKIGVYQPAA